MRDTRISGRDSRRRRREVLGAEPRQRRKSSKSRSWTQTRDAEGQRTVSTVRVVGKRIETARQCTSQALAYDMILSLVTKDIQVKAVMKTRKTSQMMICQWTLRFVIKIQSSQISLLISRIYYSRINCCDFGYPFNRRKRQCELNSLYH
jgi:hypothetical protein